MRHGNGSDYLGNINGISQLIEAMLENIQQCDDTKGAKAQLPLHTVSHRPRRMEWSLLMSAASVRHWRWFVRQMEGLFASYLLSFVI